jgi:hypothetical protein
MAIEVTFNSSAAFRKLLRRAAASKTRSEFNGGSRKAMSALRILLEPDWIFPD